MKEVIKSLSLLLQTMMIISNAKTQTHTNDNLWYNNGAAVTVQSNCLITIQGDATNNQAGITGITHLQNNGFIWIQGNLYGDNAFKQTGSGTVRLQNKTVLYTTPYAAENYQVIQGGYRVNGGQSAIAATDDGSFYNLELDNQNGLVFIKSNTDVRHSIDFKPGAVTIDGIAVAPNGITNRILTYDPGTGAAPAVAPANGADYTAIFGMMNNQGGLTNFKNASTNLAANTTTSDNGYVQGKLRRALNAASGGSYGFPVGLEPSTSSTAARGIQYVNFDFAANNYDVLTGYFQQGSDNTVSAPGTVCGISGGFVYYGSSNHGEWIFTSQTPSAEAYDLTLYPQDYGTLSSVKYFITKDNVVPSPGLQSCSTSPDGMKVTGLTGFSEFGFAGGSTVLPITLKSFSCIVNQCEARLNWVTTNEQNVRHFEVEKSPDANQWTPIATIAAIGNSTTERKYSQKVSLQINIANFFRLKTLDFDGTYSVSSVINVRCNEKQLILMFPNPIINDILSVRGLPAGTKKIQVYNALGAEVSTTVTTNNFADLSFASLPKGIYLVKALTANGLHRSVFKLQKL